METLGMLILGGLVGATLLVALARLIDAILPGPTETCHDRAARLAAHDARVATWAEGLGRRLRTWWSV